jgi:serine/tyrosine/threonine adenylyltransferase
MRAEPQDAPYRPDPSITAISGWIADPVGAAAFPRHQLRFRNRRWDKAVGLGSAISAGSSPCPATCPAARAALSRPPVPGVQPRDRRRARVPVRTASRWRGRLLDLGTKGSGTTPYSRTGDGRLTLKGAVREILATEMLEALGVNTSRPSA